MPNLHLKLQEKWPAAVTETHSQHGDETAVVKKESLAAVASFLKENPEVEHINRFIARNEGLTKSLQGDGVYKG